MRVLHFSIFTLHSSLFMILGPRDMKVGHHLNGYLVRFEN